MAAPSASARDECPAPRTYRLLVVEDHQPTLDVLARLLRKQGHAVETASSVEALWLSRPRAASTLSSATWGCRTATASI
ncbi:MAG: response regulator [Verrucomicrobiota bacterium]|nr:response regulator [Verrucomicrobiota bacterium]